MRNLSALTFLLLVLLHLFSASHSKGHDFDKRDVDTSSGDGGMDDLSEEVCTTSWLIQDPFTPISQTISNEIVACTASSDLYEDYSITINSQDSSYITLSSSDNSVLFVDHFKSNTTYNNVTVETLCTSCDPNMVELRLNITIEAYKKRLLPYGDVLSDEFLKGEDDSYIDAALDSPFTVPVYNKTYEKAYVSYQASTLNHLPLISINVPCFRLVPMAWSPLKLPRLIGTLSRSPLVHSEFLC